MKLFSILLLSLLFSLNVSAQIDSALQVQDIEEVIISIDHDPTEFYSKKDTYVLDIEEEKDGLLMLLKIRNDYYVERVSWAGDIIASQKLDFKSSAIEKDCLKNLYLRTNQGYHRFEFNVGGIVLESTFTEEEYDTEIKPCIGATDSLLVFRSWSNYNQGIHLWTFDFNGEKSQDFYTFLDTMAVKDIQDEKAIITSENYSNHARMGDIWVPELAVLRDKEERGLFFNHILVKEKYAPFFSDSSDYYLFNFLNDTIYTFNGEFELESSTSWSFKKPPRIDKMIVFDQVRGQFYWLDDFNNSFVLFNPEFCRKIRVIASPAVKARIKCIRNGKVYYLAKKSRDSAFNKVFVQSL
jgi:hypothetical protein